MKIKCFSLLITAILTNYRGLNLQKTAVFFQEHPFDLVTNCLLVLLVLLVGIIDTVSHGGCLHSSRLELAAGDGAEDRSLKIISYLQFL